MWNYIYADELYHHGVKGQKWGVRRFQNADGTLTAAGKRRIKDDGTFKSNKEYRNEIETARNEARSKYMKKYGVGDAYNKADEAEEYSDKQTKLTEKAETLESKSYKAADSEMRKKYGEDYDKFLKSEANRSTGLIIGGLLAAPVIVPAAIVAAPIALMVESAKAKRGEKAARKVLNNKNN